MVVAYEEKPPLVGKRRKKKRAKIVKLLELKEKIANGEVVAGEGYVGFITTSNFLSYIHVLQRTQG
jgi:hypothetical protein